MTNENRYPCPCCGSLTYPVPPKEDIGGYICGICWWENDRFLRSEDDPSDQNHGITLREGRQNVASCGISDPKLILGWAENGFKPWPEILRMMCRRASRFQIHCWNEETEEIALALPWGEQKKFGWEYGAVIEGTVTEAFVDFLTALPEPDDKEIYNKKTPFFSIFFNNGFSIEHYGTEVNWTDRKEQ